MASSGPVADEAAQAGTGQGGGRIMRARPQPVCYACGAPGTLLYRNLTDSLFGAQGAWSLSRCSAEGCGLIWLDPMPIEEDLHLAYQEYYTHGEAEKSVRYRAGRVLYRLASDAILATLGIPMERRRARLMFLGRARPGRLLDVGCGSGAFLVEMRKRGWNVTGLDVDPAAVATARTVHGLDVHLGTVAGLLSKGATFDAITASHVIEHVPDPVEFLTHCRQLLRAGGLLVLRTPNAHSFGLRRYGFAWRDLDPPRHLHIFTASALAACAARSGLVLSRCFTSAASADTILSASRCIARRGSFRESELSRSEKLSNWLIRPALALRAKLAWLRDRRCGEEICAVLSW